jgi:hypothetical protein
MGESSLTESKVAIPMPVGGAIGGLQVRISSTPGNAPNSYTYTVYVNGSASSVVCTITSGQRNCSDGTHTVNVGPGDTVSLRQDEYSNPTDVSVTWSFYIDP